MPALDAYLTKHFLTLEGMAAACQLPLNDFRGLVQDRLVPGPSYVVTGMSRVKSFVFGDMPAGFAQDGEYFHPATAAWVIRAQAVIADVGRERAHEVLKLQFDRNIRSALAVLNASTWHMADSFTDDGAVLEEGMRKRLDSMWTHFLAGTFGLCVANPVSEQAIAQKEVLQEKLTALSGNGARADFSPDEAAGLLELIDAFAQSAMPFSPVEYPLSSRKRLVDDLSVRLKAIAAR
ncbi:DUF6058 family natural product biosynthesis protein [Pseudoduganella violaceinigra]|uniref:DUF6058 family natural product biosynthesis protein n=1 Tax=Pseudoduganella violaceinigra TaxID=246602 RepID=UPI0004243542|nr:DUF6058 family natural product biosynthesis protein [Pseudoduganella violaceinigra]